MRIVKRSIVLRYHLAPVRRAVIRKSTRAGKDVENGEPCALLAETQTGAATVDACSFLKILDMELPYYPTFGNVSKESQPERIYAPLCS